MNIQQDVQDMQDEYLFMYNVHVLWKLFHFGLDLCGCDCEFLISCLWLPTCNGCRINHIPPPASELSVQSVVCYSGIYL